MAKSLLEYAEWLDGRNLVWPQPPKLKAPKATPYLKPLAGIRAVTWSVYGTLLRIADGRLVFNHPQQLRMQVALEKTIQEFNMWHSMGRKPGAPWEYMLQQYTQVLSEQEMAGTKHKGDFPAVNLVAIWRKLIGRLEQKEYQYDAGFYGDLDELSEKVAYFFHRSLQGVEAAPAALRALESVSRAGLTQGLLGDAQPFTLPQLLRAFKAQGTLPPVGDLFASNGLVLSDQEGVRTPSKSLYRQCVERFAALGIEPGEILHVGSRVRDDLAVAKEFGMRTALYAGDKTGLEAAPADLKDPALKPDRLLTDLKQIREVLSLG